MNLKMGAGGLLALLAVGAVLVIAGLRWLGANAALIGAGIWAAGEVVFAGAVLYAAGTLAWKLYQGRRAAPAETQDAPPPMRVPSERVPLTSALEEPLALPPGGTHFHFGDMDEQAAARLIRLIRGDDHDE